MKKIIICAAIFFTAAIFKNSDAQVRLNVNVNIGSQPVWGPVGYDYVDYYYLPDIEAYYYVPRHQFIYLSDGRWIFSSSLPVRYRNYDLYNGYKVVINEPNSYLHFTSDRLKYSRYRGNHQQVIIRNSNDPKYYVVRGHPKYKGNPAHNFGNAGNRGRQVVIRNNNRQSYYAANDHPKYKNNPAHGNGRGEGNGRGKGHH